MSYLDFLTKLIALGPKLPQLVLIIQDIVRLVQEAIELMVGPLPLKADFEPSGAELTKENEVMAALQGHGGTEGIGDGSVLRFLFKFMKDHPELLALVLKLLKPV